MATLGDQSAGALVGRSCAWLRCRLAGGQHDAPPGLAGLHLDAATAVAAHPYSSALPVPAGAVVTGRRPPVPSRAVVSLVVTASGDVTAVRVRSPVREIRAVPRRRTSCTGPRLVVPRPAVAGGDRAGRGGRDPRRSVPAARMWCGAAPLIWVTEPDGILLCRCARWPTWPWRDRATWRPRSIRTGLWCGSATACTADAGPRHHRPGRRDRVPAGSGAPSCRRCR